MTENRAPEGQREPTTRDIKAMALDIEECVGLEREYANQIAATLRDLSRKLEEANDRRAEAERFADAINAAVRRYGATGDASDHGPERAIALLEHAAASHAEDRQAETHRAQLFHESEKRKAAEAALEEVEADRETWWKRAADALTALEEAKRERKELTERLAGAYNAKDAAEARVEALEAALRESLTALNAIHAGRGYGVATYNAAESVRRALATPTEPEQTEEAGHE